MKTARMSKFTQSLFVADIPENWRLVPVGAVLAESEYGLSEPSDSAGNVRIVGMKDLVDGYVNTDDLGTIDGGESGWLHMQLRAGDLLLNRTNSADLVGKVGIVKEDSDAVFASYLVRLKTKNEKVEPSYLNFWLNSEIAQRALKRLSTRGVSQSNINPTEFKKHCPVPLPPLPEQRKIAEILQTWDEAFEKLDALLSRRQLYAAALRQRIFEAEYKSDERVARARDLFDTVSERARPDLPLLAVMQDIGVVRRDEIDRRVAMPDGDTSSYKVVRPGDFVISLRSFEGGLEYSGITGLVSPAYTVLRPIQEISGSYYRHFFKSRSFVGRLDRLIFGIRDGKQISFRDFGDMRIPNPPLDEQAQHAELMDLLERGIAIDLTRKKVLSRQKRGLMQKLLTGEWSLKLTGGNS